MYEKPKKSYRVNIKTGKYRSLSQKPLEYNTNTTFTHTLTLYTFKTHLIYTFSFLFCCKGNSFSFHSALLQSLNNELNGIWKCQPEIACKTYGLFWRKLFDCFKKQQNVRKETFCFGAGCYGSFLSVWKTIFSIADKIYVYWIFHKFFFCFVSYSFECLRCSAKKKKVASKRIMFHIIFSSLPVQPATLNKQFPLSRFYIIFKCFVVYHRLFTQSVTVVWFKYIN